MYSDPDCIENSLKKLDLCVLLLCNDTRFLFSVLVLIAHHNRIKKEKVERGGFLVLLLIKLENNSQIVPLLLTSDFW